MESDSFSFALSQQPQKYSLKSLTSIPNTTPFNIFYMKYDIFVALYSLNYLIIMDLFGFVIELSIFELFRLLS